MSEPRPFASLSPSLLARKGAARPAMRPQLQPLRHFHEATARQPDDLGWNDMGYDIDPPAPTPAEPPATESAAAERAAAEHTAEVVAIVPQAAASMPGEAPAVPEVVRGQQELAARIEGQGMAAEPQALDPKASGHHAPGPQEPVPDAITKAAARLAPSRRRRAAADDGRRAAFTLRLDSDRHLRLRLACTVGNRSAQQLVTEALDRLLSAMPEIDGLARQVRQGQ